MTEPAQNTTPSEEQFKFNISYSTPLIRPLEEMVKYRAYQKKVMFKALGGDFPARPVSSSQLSGVDVLNDDAIYLRVGWREFIRRDRTLKMLDFQLFAEEFRVKVVSPEKEPWAIYGRFCASCAAQGELPLSFESFCLKWAKNDPILKRFI